MIKKIEKEEKEKLFQKIYFSWGFLAGGMLLIFSMLIIGQIASSSPSQELSPFNLGLNASLCIWLLMIQLAMKKETERGKNFQAMLRGFLLGGVVTIIPILVISPVLISVGEIESSVNTFAFLGGFFSWAIIGIIIYHKAGIAQREIKRIEETEH